MRIVWVIMLSLLFITAQGAKGEPQFGQIEGSISAGGRLFANLIVYLTNDTIRTFEEANATGLITCSPYVSKPFLRENHTETEYTIIPQGPAYTETEYILSKVPPGIYTIHARAVRGDEKIVFNKVPNLVVKPGVTTKTDLTLDSVIIEKINEINGDLDKIAIIDLNWEGPSWKEKVIVNGTVTNKANSLQNVWIRGNFYDAGGTYLGYAQEYFGICAGLSQDFMLSFESKYVEHAYSASLEVNAEKTHVSGDTEKAEIITFSLEPYEICYIDESSLELIEGTIAVIYGTASNNASTMQNISIKAQFCDKDGKLLGEGVDIESRVPAGYPWDFHISFKDMKWSDVQYGGYVCFKIESKEVRE
jgi:hypothetical protein